MSYAKYVVLLFPVLMYSQTRKIHGFVFDDSTNQVLPFASIRVENTDIVTLSNKEGQFVLDLPSGKDSVFVTYVGYTSRHVYLSAGTDSPARIGLHPAVIQLPEYFVIGTLEDPARDIMREAIKRRKKNYSGLLNYEVGGYRRNVLYSGGRIVMIDEQLVKQMYDEKGRLNKDFILATHKTENIKKKPVRISLDIGASLVFIQDTFGVRIGQNGNRIVFPLADDAFEFYDFKLLNTKKAGNEISHTIQIIPRSSITPLVRGKIIIDDATYALIGADIESGEGWIFPLVKNFSLKIQQTYSNYHGFWIPQYSETELSGELSALGGLISMDEMKLSEVFSLNSCKVNGAVPDSVKKAKRSKFGGYTTDTSKAVSPLRRTKKTKAAPRADTQLFEPANRPPELASGTMDSLRPLPLTGIEKIAFAELDSTKTLDKVMTPKGALSGLASSSDTAKSFFSSALSVLWHHGILHNNRVEGISPGAWIESDKMDMDWFYNAELVYATGLKMVEWKIGGGYNLGDDHLDRIDVNIWSAVQQWQSSPYISKSINSILFSITGEDYFNYMRSSGFHVGLHKYFTDDWFAKIYYSAERDRSVSENSFVSLFKKNRRINPSINEGQNNALQLQIGFESSARSSFLSQNRYRLVVTAEYSKPDFGSDFNYQKYSFLGSVRLSSIYPTMMNAPYLFISFAGGVIAGEYGIQHLLTPPTALSFYALSGVLKGVRQYDLVGDRYIFVQGEHNWKTLPFTLFRSKKMEESGIQFITGASIANAWNSSSYAVQQNNWKPYWEVYLGISNIIDLFRIDLVHSSNNINSVRLSISSLIFD